jgi:hypothetical protein
VGKKKEKSLMLQRKKEKLENGDSCHLLNIKKRRALYIYQSIGRHSITGEASFFYDRHGNGQTIHRHAQRSHCSFGGDNRKNKISIHKYRHLQKSDGGDRISYRNNAFCSSNELVSFQTATDCFVPSVLLLLAAENKAAAEDPR